MAEINSKAEERSEQETKGSPTNTASMISSQNTVNDVTMEPEKTSAEKETVPCSSGGQNNTGPKMYTEAEKLKRKEYFKRLREKKQLQFQRRLSLLKNPQPKINKTVTISYDMTDEDTKMLDFYKVRLSTLRRENQELHKRLAYIVNENMKYLQRGPPTRVRYTL